MKLVYNRLEFDEKSIEERKSLLKLLGNERIDRAIQYLEKFKFELVKDIAHITTDIGQIKLRDGGIQTLETIIRHLKESKTKESYINKVTGETVLLNNKV